MCLFYSSDYLKFKDIIEYPEICIPERSFVFLTGKSGCGKSSYLKILNRMILPENGTILYHGKELSEYPVLAYRRDVLLVPQDVFLVEGTIRDNFNFYYDARETERLSDEDINMFLEICCCKFSSLDVCNKMSGGERQRVFLSIFLSFAQKVLLLDEPTAAIDEKTSDLLFHNLKQYCREKGITVLCVSHDQRLVQRFSDDVIRLEELNND